MISALLLCAGQSRRMGVAKTLLKIGSDFMVKHCARQMLDTDSIDELICVTGAQADEVEAELSSLAAPDLRLVRNPHYQDGLMSSIKAGVAALHPSTRAFVVGLADLPELKCSDFEDLIQFSSKRRALLVRCRYRAQPAHPVWVSTALKSEILRADVNDRGLNFLFARHRAEFLEVDHGRGCRDVDTAEEFANADLPG